MSSSLETGQTQRMVSSCCIFLVIIFVFVSILDAVIEYAPPEMEPQIPAKEPPSESSESEEDENNIELLNPGQSESLLIPEDELDDLVVKIAPGEGNVPMSILIDQHAEILSFPSIYGGQPRTIPEDVRLTMGDIAKSEARRHDQRATRPTKILYSYVRLRTSRILEDIQICLRKKRRRDGKPITAGQLLSKEFIENLVQHDDGFRMLKGIRSSPAFWEAQKRKALGMIRQLGKPTFFVTLSAAETKWSELLSSLLL